ncbi:MAG: FMN-binding protein [Thiotrichales bacterium]|nr:FMN-binding protein [Thiotrichales bacterium]
MAIKYLKLLFACLCLAVSPALQATGVYQEPDDFIADVFSGNPPGAKRLWIKKDLHKEIKRILERDLGVLRLRYWREDNRTAWILEEIGKEKPITTGLVVNNHAIEQLKILIFRESRGWEVRHPFFTDQFKGIRLKANTRLDKKIDAISGATLSRNAMIKLSRLALFLHDKVINK